MSKVELVRALDRQEPDRIPHVVEEPSQSKLEGWRKVVEQVGLAEGQP